MIGLRHTLLLFLMIGVCQILSAKALDQSLNYIYEFELDRYILVKGVRPNRVYYKYVSEIDRWVFVRSRQNATFPSPLQVLAIGSVLAGKQLGSRSSNAHYMLQKNGKWTPTKEDKKYRVWNLSNPPVLKILYSLD